MRRTAKRDAQLGDAGDQRRRQGGDVLRRRQPRPGQVRPPRRARPAARPERAHRLRRRPARLPRPASRPHRDRRHADGGADPDARPRDHGPAGVAGLDLHLRPEEPARPLPPARKAARREPVEAMDAAGGAGRGRPWRSAACYASDRLLLDPAPPRRIRSTTGSMSATATLRPASGSRSSPTAGTPSRRYDPNGTIGETHRVLVNRGRPRRP